MSIIVQKFGGTSVATPDLIRSCAERVAATRRSGKRVVVVVSAMGHSTDELVSLATRVNPEASRRELDQLLSTGEQVSVSLMAIALEALGVPAISLTGAQCGIRTDNAAGRARILKIDTARLRQELETRVPVVAGFQGVADNGDVTTLGRGGSDTTAVGLAAALDAEVCEIYTDVDGVYTADPNVVPNARLRERISYDEMLEAAALGAKVMHLRAVELGKERSVPIRVLHSRRHGPGTLICADPSDRKWHTERELPVDSTVDLTNPGAGANPVSSVALMGDIGRVTLTGLANRPGLQEWLFRPIGEADVSVDDIIQTETDPHRVDIAFTVDADDVREVRRIVATLGLGEAKVETGLSKVSAIGVGMRSQAGVATTMFQALAAAKVEITNISTSEIRISCLIHETDGPTALRVVHDVFELGSVGGGPPSTAAKTSGQQSAHI